MQYVSICLPLHHSVANHKSSTQPNKKTSKLIYFAYHLVELQKENSTTCGVNNNISTYYLGWDA